MISNIIVAGVRGGVGTTTVTALLHALLRGGGAEVTLADHTDGHLASRVTEAAGSLGVSIPALAQRSFAPESAGHATINLLDAGIWHAPLAPMLADQFTALVLVCSPGSLDAARATLAAVSAAHDLDAARVHLFLVDVNHQLRRRPSQDRVEASVVLPWNSALVPWGPVPLTRLASSGRSPVQTLATAFTSILSASPN